VAAHDPTMARKPFVADEALREKVRYLAGVGVSQDDIARIIGCAPKTLRKRFRDELDRGIAEANAMVCGYLFAAAKAGNIAAIIFWLKTRAHWRERPREDAAPPRADAEANSPVLLVLPDNSRDGELSEALRVAQENYFAEKPMTRDPTTSGRLALPSEERAVLSEDALDAPADLPPNLLQANPGQSAAAPGM